MAAIKRSPVITQSARTALPVTPDDDNDLTYVATWLYVGAGGDVVVTTLDGNDATFANVPPGTLLPIQVTRVKFTGTSASQILAMD